MGEREILQTLSDAIKKLLDDPVPRDRPGLVAYDSYWGVLCRNLAFRALPEIEAIIEYNKLVKGEIAPAFPQPELKEMALRLVDALSIHRLTKADIYSRHGTTPAELRDMLCLYLPGIEEAGGEPPYDLLLHVVAVLDVVVKKTIRNQFLAYNPESNHYFLHLRKFKCFVKPELLLHWVNAVPFLFLMITGSLMVASRFYHIDHELFILTVTIHKVSAFTWIIALPLVVLLRAKVHWLHIRPMLSWGKDDLLWMVQSARSLYNKKVIIPAAGRFNTGQKINACLVMIYFFGFATTGSVGGHLFLALVNPSTRIALAGIFHGWSPMKYVEHHHPLSLPQSLRSHVEPVTVRTVMDEIFVSKVKIVTLAVAVAMASIGVLTFSQGQLTSVKKVFAKNFADSIQPHDLSTKHRIGAAAESCTKCHSYTGQIPNDKCEQCHLYIKERRLKGIGYHGTFKEDCRVCHKEHPEASRPIVLLDKKKFDHNLAGFRLDGRHVKVDCDQCHKKERTPEIKGVYFTGLKFAACAKCHSTDGWKRPDLKFSHDTDSTYKLEGKHQTVDCAKCHKPKSSEAALGTARFKGLPTDCTGCHEDPHRKQFTQACTACHSPAGWKKESLIFSHNRDTQFQLLGPHARVACQKCHRPAPGEQLAQATMHGLKSGCGDCHRDPHRGQFQTGCVQCHPVPGSWRRELHFDHTRDSTFALVGKHATVECIQCHKPQPPGSRLASAQFKGLGTSCETCHTVKHPVEYGPTCLSCHTTQNWIKKKPAADHVSRNEVNDELLLGKHITARCDSCHNLEKIPTRGQLGLAKYDCVTCHAKDDPHKGTLGTTCSKCHSTEGWKGENLRFNHDTMTRYGLNQDHNKVACVKCHENNHWKPLNTACVSCHPKYAEGNNGGKSENLRK